jgi:hypothetical protein
MAARGVTASVLDSRAAQVERIIENSALHGSESLSRLLRYLAHRTIQDPGTAVREPEIAAEVFGRASFDPRIDSTVRVNVTRLRAKLSEYYHGLGADDPLLVDLPKGSYAIVFQKRSQEVPSPPPIRPEAETVPPPPEYPGRQRVNRWLLGAAVAMTLIAAMLAATLLFEHRATADSANRNPASDNRSLRRFWGMLLDRPGEPWIVFSNATFVGRPATGMRYMVPSKDSGREVLDFYTGIGEVLGVHALDRTFALLNRAGRVKRGGLLSLDDVENNDLVYVGSPLENLTLREVPGLQDFEFKLMENGPLKDEGALVNKAPRDGEPKLFLPSALPLTEDYAVVALVPGLNPARWALILAGTSTIGTEGAVEFVCRDDTVKELLNRIGNTSGPRPLFEAVLDIEIKGGVPVRSKLVAFHPRRPPA